MIGLLDLDSDVLENILRFLEPLDLLDVERVCKALHDLVTTKHMWLIQLQQLEACYSPSIPSHVDVKSLAYEELRQVVIKAIRWHEACKKGLAASPKTLVSSARLQDRRDLDVSLRHRLVQLTSDGKYLVIYWLDEGFGVYCVRTAERICWWTDKVAGLAQSFCLRQCSDDEILILLTCQKSKSPVPGGPMLFRLLQLHLCARRITEVRSNSLIPTRPNSQFMTNYDALSDRFGVMGKHDMAGRPGPSFLIWDLQNDCIKELHLEPGWLNAGLHISHGNLFFSFKDMVRSKMTVEIIPLQQVAETEETVVRVGDIEKHNLVLDLLELGYSGALYPFFECPRVFNLALFDYHRTGARKSVEGCAMIRLFDNGERSSDIVACRFTVDFLIRDGKDHLEVNSLPHATMQCSTSTVGRRVGRVGLRHICENRRSGQTLLSLSPMLGPYLSSSRRDDYIVGTDRRNGLFIAPFRPPLGDLQRVMFDQTSGAIVRFIPLRDHDMEHRIEVHYAS